MATITEQIEKIKQIKNKITDAAKEKGCSVEFSECAESIAQLQANKATRFGISSNFYFGNVTEDGQLTKLPNVSENAVFSGVQYVAENALQEKFSCKHINSASFPDLKTISNNNACYQTFYGCSINEPIDFPMLTEISGNGAAKEMFASSNIKGVNLGAIKKIEGSETCMRMFNNCGSLTNANIEQLERISGDYSCYEMFYECDKLSTATMNNLLEIYGFSAANSMFNILGEFTCVEMGKLKNISGEYACAHMFAGHPGYGTSVYASPLEQINLGSLESISGQRAAYHMFYKRSNLQQVELPKLKTVSGESVISGMFSYCKGLKSLSLPLLESIDGKYAISSLCYGNIALETINLNSLRSINGDYALCVFLKGCEKISRIDFPSLQEILSNKAFSGTSNDETYYPFYGCTNLTEIHFRYDIKQLVEGLEGYDKKFGAENATIYFDLGCSELEIIPTPSNATVKFYDAEGTEIPNPTVTEVSKYAWSVGEEVFYTDNEAPSVGDEVYDSEGNLMTQKVTSISDNTITIG